MSYSRVVTIAFSWGEPAEETHPADFEPESITVNRT
jgi:hypothetical protein